MDLFWKTEKRKVRDLKLFEGNPRKMSRKQAEDLLDSLKKFNYVELVVVDQNNRVIAGNMRVQALKKMGKDNEEIEVRVPSRPITDKEAREYLLRSNKNVGEWDYGLLANFDEEMLKNVGWSEREIEKIFDVGFTIYSRKVKSPIYKPRGLKVGIYDLYDDSKCLKLLEKIEKLNVDKKIKKFLKFAAYRFVEFNFKNIAEYYSKLKNEELKEIFEDLALVVIDYDKAIEKGFADLVKDILKQIKEEYGE